MMGGICINEWLKREGYLVLEHQPEGIVPLEKCEVDWSRTKAWAAGGYYARVYLNVAGREPEGIVDPADYERLRDELAAGIAAICGPDGQNLGSISFKPQEIYREVNNIPPDLIAYLGKMGWRSVASLGWDGIYSHRAGHRAGRRQPRPAGVVHLLQPGGPGPGAGRPAARAWT